ncbi:MAG: VacJ family lipoprotein [Methylomonas sp.]|jgi:phospholipid-binding lipoprotein MlaA|uniref:MlaA family lipoprotein n=1 Tax=Methylomonas sp. TaxID=418 RepID=UPI0025FE02EE|nr:VacJ family lipoprotein [Methylomonas sp.]MCK9608598.1 VacJ family lipoprotein [Methylomonas sp.]
MRGKIIGSLVAIGAMALMNGCATVQSPDPRDPWESWNRGVQSFNDDVDSYVMKPVAKGYKWVMPDFADQGVTNFFSNLDDIGVFTNDLLQAKLMQSGMDTARFLVNTTAGVGGLVDVASMIDLPKHNEDFDQTLGVWGLPTGPYIVLPLFGPSSPRGVVGLVGDAAMNPITYAGFYLNPEWIGAAVSMGSGALKVIDARSDLLGMEKVATEAALDRYQFFRDAYLSNRNYLVNDGNVPEDDVLKFEDLKDDGYGPLNTNPY